MGRKTCPIQDICPKVNLNGAPPDHWHRFHTPCQFFLDMTCEKSVDIQLFLGDEISCDIDKIKNIKTAHPKTSESPPYVPFQSDVAEVPSEN